MTEKYHMPQNLELVPPENDILNQVAEAVGPDEIDSEETQGFIEAMLDFAYSLPRDPAGRTIVGLAAPQLGYNKRIIIVDLNADGSGTQEPDFTVYINPEILDLSDTTTLGREGCYSTGSVCVVLPRADRIRMKATDRLGKPILETFRGFQARALQHEGNHLDGIRAPDLVTDDNNLLWVEPEEFGEFRNNWQNWPNKCLRSKWQAMKAGQAD